MWKDDADVVGVWFELQNGQRALRFLFALTRCASSDGWRRLADTQRQSRASIRSAGEFRPFLEVKNGRGWRLTRWVLCAGATGDMNICYVLDGVLILYGIILTALYCRLRVRPPKTHKRWFITNLSFNLFWLLFNLFKKRRLLLWNTAENACIWSQIFNNSAFFVIFLFL